MTSTDPPQGRPPSPPLPWTLRHATAIVGLIALALALTTPWKTEDERLSEREARDAARTAQEQLATYRREADPALFQELCREARDDLWPRRPDKIAAMESWLFRVRTLEERLPDHLAFLRETEGRRLSGEATASEPQSRQVLTKLHQYALDLKKARVPRNGIYADVEARLRMAEEIVARTVDDYEDAWKEAISEIQNHPLYGGLELSPQVGLIPLAPDPVSGLWEFLFWESGQKPLRDPDSGRWVLNEETGLVMVLIPGGTFIMGASPKPESSNYDPSAQVDEEMREIHLSAYFLSKYEMTQGQWKRYTGETPSFFIEKDETMSHPVEQVSWTMCERVLSRLGLEFPTEAQWEFACRAGTSTAWFTGNDEATLQGHANLIDKAYTRRFRTESALTGWDDGYAAHAPVGRFVANTFGIHDMHGNVWEWCRDKWSGGGWQEPRKGDGLRYEAEAPFRLYRGGSFNLTGIFARSANRSHNTPDGRFNDLGLRPALRVQ